MESGNSNINEGIKYSKNCAVLTVNKHDALVRKNASEAANTPPKACNKPLLNQNVPQCVDILNKTVVDPLLEKIVIGSSRVIDGAKTLISLVRAYLRKKTQQKQLKRTKSKKVKRLKRVCHSNKNCLLKAKLVMPKWFCVFKCEGN